MRQDVTCMRCKYVSTTIQHFMDLLLDIRQVSLETSSERKAFSLKKISLK